MKSTLKGNVHFFIGLAIGILIRLLVPASNGLTDQGVWTLAVSIATVYWWITYNINWVTLLSITLFVATGAFSDSFTASFGNKLFIYYIMIYVISNYLITTGVISRLLCWTLSRKVLKGRPWMFVGVYMAACFIANAILDIGPGAYITHVVAYKALEMIGYEKGKGDKFSNAFMVGCLWVSLWGYASTPFGHSVTLVALATAESLLGVTVTTGKYILCVMPAAAILSVLGYMYIRFILHPDTSRFANYNPQDMAKECSAPWSKGEKYGVILYLILIVSWFLPDIFVNIAPNFAAYMKAQGVTLSTVVIASILAMTYINCKRAINFTEELGKIQWNSIILLFGMIALGTAMSNADAGIVIWVQNLLLPMTEGMTSAVPFLLFLCFAIALITNFMSNTVCVQLGCVIGIPLALALPAGTINPAALTMALCIAANAGVMTPSASGGPVFYYDSEYLDGGFMFRHGLFDMVIAVLGSVFVAYPLGCLVFPF